MAVAEREVNVISPSWTAVAHDWVSTVDHKKIGILYILMSLVFLFIGGVEALLMRWQLVQTGEHHFVLVHVEHHLVHDGWSWGVFLQELATLYGAAVADRPSPLPALPIQFRDYAQWQRRLVGRKSETSAAAKPQPARCAEPDGGSRSSRRR